MLHTFWRRLKGGNPPKQLHTALLSLLALCQMNDKRWQNTKILSLQYKGWHELQAVIELIVTAPLSQDKMQFIEDTIHDALQTITYSKQIQVILTQDHIQSAQTTTAHSPTGKKEKITLPAFKKIIAVTSGKGGVGKSTIAMQIALNLQAAGKTVAMLDADIYGPSLPCITGFEGKRAEVNDANQLIPLTYQENMQIMSIGFMSDPHTPIIWRGPMVMGAFEQMLTQTAWQKTDILVIDMPPGTGDIHLSLAQRLQVDGAVIISTPQKLALNDALKGFYMLDRVQVPVFGLIANMAEFTCHHCHTNHDLFDKAGLEERLKAHNIPLIATLPLLPTLRSHADMGTLSDEPQINTALQPLINKIIKTFDPA